MLINIHSGGASAWPLPRILVVSGADRPAFEGPEINMRIALIATSVAAAVAIPMAVAAAGPQMTSSEFLSAVQCVAYESFASPNADLGVAKLRLNAEASRQPAEVAAAAQREARAVSAAVQAGETIEAARCRASRIADEGRASRAV